MTYSYPAVSVTVPTDYDPEYPTRAQELLAIHLLDVFATLSGTPCSYDEGDSPVDACAYSLTELSQISWSLDAMGSHVADAVSTDDVGGIATTLAGFLTALLDYRADAESYISALETLPPGSDPPALPPAPQLPTTLPVARSLLMLIVQVIVRTVIQALIDRIANRIGGEKPTPPDGVEKIVDAIDRLARSGILSDIEITIDKTAEGRINVHTPTETVTQ